MVTIVRTTFAGNRAVVGGAGIFSGNARSITTMTNSTVVNNIVTLGDGGGIYNFGTLTITSSTLAGNSAGSFGGGIFNEAPFGLGGMLTLTNSTLAGNTVATLNAKGGGLYNDSGTVTITNSTLSDNAAPRGRTGGLANVFLGTVVLQNTILARNAVGLIDNISDCSGEVTSLGNNLIGDPTGCNINLQSTDLTGDPGLGAFVDDGAPGNGRLPLLSGSPAIGAGNIAACPHTDQLGTPRRGPCDIGAVEFYPLVNDLVSLANVNTAFDPTPVAGGPAGTFRVSVDFTNMSAQPIGHRFAEVVELSGGNLLLNGDGGAGGVGARVTGPDSGTLFLPGATATFDFAIGLQKQEPFTFFVNLLGDPQTSNSFVTLLGESQPAKP